MFRICERVTVFRSRQRRSLMSLTLAIFNGAKLTAHATKNQTCTASFFLGDISAIVEHFAQRGQVHVLALTGLLFRTRHDRDTFGCDPLRRDAATAFLPADAVFLASCNHDERSSFVENCVN